MGIKPTEWGREQTAKGGPFPELLNYDILINAIYLLPEVRLPAFITKGMIDHTPDRSAPFTLHNPSLAFKSGIPVLGIVVVVIIIVIILMMQSSVGRSVGW